MLDTSNRQDMRLALASINDLRSMILCEQHSEIRLLPYLMKITKTDFGKALGLPVSFWDGSYTKDGEKKMIRLQDIIHKGAWKKHLLRPSEHPLPPGFAIVHFSLTRVATDYTRFFLSYYSPRYRSLPNESKILLWHSSRACAIWEACEEKVAQGIDGFACPWVYNQVIEGRKLFNAYPQELIKINRAAKAYRNSKGRYGYSAEVAYDRRQEVYSSLNAQAEALAAIQPPNLDPLPVGASVLQLLEEPTIDVFAVEE